jgi:hypothetical protein
MKWTTKRRYFIAFAIALLVWLLVSQGPDSFAQMHWRGFMTGTLLSTFETASFSGSGNCAFCHDALMDEAGNDVSINSHWRSTMMANSAKDPLWQAKVSSEVERNPSLKSTIEEKCSRCHMGMARYQAMANGRPVAVLGTGFLNSNHPLHSAAMDGVSCTLCHQIQESGSKAESRFTGKYVIDTSTSPPYRWIFGPHEEPFPFPMQMRTGFSPTTGAYVAESAFCSTCHTLYTPYFDAKGEEIGQFPEQMTYLEWKHSRDGGGIGSSKTCQDCHTPDAAGWVAISNRPPWIDLRIPFGQHHFVGGNSYMLSLLKANASSLGVTADPAHFDASISRTNSQLQSRTAALSLSSMSREDESLTFTLTVENRAGHKFPSGIPLRRSWLHVSVSNSEGVLFESGKPLPDGSIQGNSADLKEKAFEPHHDLITLPDQVQIYEPVMLDGSGKVTFTLLDAVSYAKDNRILPSGFNKNTASKDIAVAGKAAADSNFASGEDQVTYRVSVPKGALSIRAQLLYQSVSYSFIKDLRRSDTDLVKRFMSMHEASDKKPKVIAAIEKTVE